jgi:tRNA-binding protein
VLLLLWDTIDSRRSESGGPLLRVDKVIRFKAKIKNHMATIEDFNKLDIRVGRVLEVDEFPEARKPAYKLTIDFGPEIGIKRSSVQITQLYQKDELPGKLVLGVVNFPPRRIGPFESETLTLGVPDEAGNVILVVPDRGKPKVGGKLY